MKILTSRRGAPVGQVAKPSDPNRKPRVRIPLGALAAGLCLALSGCATMSGAPLVNCAKVGLLANASDLLPMIDNCLQERTWKKCLLGLAKPASGITVDTIACSTQTYLDKHAMSDPVALWDSPVATAKSEAKLARAEAFLAGYRFE